MTLYFNKLTAVIRGDCKLILAIVTFEILLQRYFARLSAHLKQLPVTFLQFVSHFAVIAAIHVYRVNLNDKSKMFREAKWKTN